MLLDVYQTARMAEPALRPRLVVRSALRAADGLPGVERHRDGPAPA